MANAAKLETVLSKYKGMVVFEKHAKKEFESLSKEMKAKFYYILELVKSQGVNLIQRPHIAPLSKGLREIRMIAKQGHARALFTLKKGKMAILRVFKKKTQEVPDKEKSVALERSKHLSEEPFDVTDMFIEDMRDSEIRDEFVRLLQEHVAERDAGLLEEGVYDTGIFKGIFVVAGPGAGKSFIVNKLGLKKYGLKYIVSDVFLEKILKKAGKGLDLEKIDYHNERFKAQAITEKQKNNYIAGRLGIIQETTLSRTARTAAVIADMKKLGYEVSLIFISTDIETAMERNSTRERKVPKSVAQSLHDEINTKVKELEKSFSPKNVHVVNNGKDQSKMEKDVARAKEKLLKWIAQPPKSPKAKKWVDIQMKAKSRS